MIQIKMESVWTYSCDNCNRIIDKPLIFEFCDGKRKWNEFGLCEDCASALTGLKDKCVKTGKPFKYEKDQIEEIKEEEK